MKLDWMTSTKGGSFGAVDFHALNKALARGGHWSVAEVARLVDVDAAQVALWLRSGELLSVLRDGETMIPARALFLFLSGAVEPMLSPETVALKLDAETRTVRAMLKAKRIPSVKLGTARGAPRRVLASDLRKWQARLAGKEAA